MASICIRSGARTLPTSSKTDGTLSSSKTKPATTAVVAAVWADARHQLQGNAFGSLVHDAVDLGARELVRPAQASQAPSPARHADKKARSTVPANVPAALSATISAASSYTIPPTRPRWRLSSKYFAAWIDPRASSAGNETSRCYSSSAESPQAQHLSPMKASVRQAPADTLTTCVASCSTTDCYRNATNTLPASRSGWPPSSMRSPRRPCRDRSSSSRPGIINRIIADCTQQDVDEYLASGPTTRHPIRTFFIWAKKSKINVAVQIGHRKAKTTPTITQQQRLCWLKELLTGDSDSLPYRIAGSLLLLYAQPLTKIAALQATAVTDLDGETRIALGEEPIPVPQPFASQLNYHLRNRPNLRTAGGTAGTPWLFPSNRPGRHLDPQSIMMRLRWLGVDLLGSRNTALQELVSEVPPPLVAEMLGYSYQVTQRHAELAGTNWAKYAPSRNMANSRRKADW
jgi:hypothetical protein